MALILMAGYRNSLAQFAGAGTKNGGERRNFSPPFFMSVFA